MWSEPDYVSFMDRHIAARTGEARRRLVEGRLYAEKEWLKKVFVPVTGGFAYLHPQYEVRDYKGGVRYLDFAYIRGLLHIAIEIDGISVHGGADKWRFADDRHRFNHMLGGGWLGMRFSAAEVRENPKLCQADVQLVLGFWTNTPGPVQISTLVQREILRFALGKVNAITPGELAAHLGVSTRYAREQLHQMVRKGWMRPASGTQRIRSYELVATMQQLVQILQ